MQTFLPHCDVTHSGGLVVPQCRPGERHIAHALRQTGCLPGHHQQPQALLHGVIEGSSDQRCPISRRTLLRTAAAVPAVLLGFAAAPPLLLLAHAAAATANPQSADGGCTLISTPSGLQYCDLRVGEGPEPLRGAFTKVHYTATLASTGAVFDDSYSRKRPLTLKPGQREVMQAWDDALLGSEGIPPMHEGGKRRIVVPPGPLQSQGTLSLVWMAGLLDAIQETGEKPSSEGSFNLSLCFDLELVPRRRRR